MGRVVNMLLETLVLLAILLPDAQGIYECDCCSCPCPCRCEITPINPFTETPIEPTTCFNICLDLGVIVDGSSNVPVDTWPDLLEFLEALAAIGIGDPANSMAIVQYGATAKQEVGFRDAANDNYAALRSKISSIEQLGGPGASLTDGIEVFLNTTWPMRHVTHLECWEVNHIVVIISAGITNIRLKSLPSAVKALGNKLSDNRYALAAGNADPTQLAGVVGSADRVFYISEYRDFIDLISTLTGQICTGNNNSESTTTSLPIKCHCGQCQCSCDCVALQPPMTPQPDDTHFTSTACYGTCLDLGLIVDGSSAIPNANWDDLRHYFFVALTEAFTIGPDATQIAMVQFASNAVQEFPFNGPDNANNSALAAKVASIPQLKGAVSLTDGIELFMNTTWPTRRTTPIMPKCALISHIVLIFSASVPNVRLADLNNAYALLNSALGDMRFAMAVGDADVSILADAVGSIDRVHYVESYNQIINLLSSTVTEICYGVDISMKTCPPCSCSVTGELQSNTATNWAVQLVNDPIAIGQNALKGLYGSAGSVRVDRQSKYTIKMAEKSGFCVQGITLDAKCAAKVTVKVHKFDGTDDVQQVTMTNPSGWGSASLTFTPPEKTSQVTVKLTPAAGCNLATFKNLKMVYCVS